MEEKHTSALFEWYVCVCVCVQVLSVNRLPDASPCLEEMGYSPAIDPVGVSVPATQGISLLQAPSSGNNKKLLLITSPAFITI